MCSRVRRGGWPAIGELQRLLDAGDLPVRNAAGLPVRLVPPARRTGAREDRYEARVFLRGELEVRERNWHDLFNVLVWRVFPLAKAACQCAPLRGGTRALRAGQPAGRRRMR